MHRKLGEAIYSGGSESTMTEERTQAAPPPEPLKPAQRSNTRRTVLALLLAIVVLAILTALGYGMLTHPRLTATLRDISIISLALVSTIIGLFLVILVFQVQSLIVLLRDEIEPLLRSANETIGTVRGTANFLSDSVVNPVISAASYVSLVRETLRALVGSRPKNKAGGDSGGQK
jgi:hypothetical protein